MCDADVVSDNDSPPDSPDDEDDLKRRFREAVERKQARNAELHAAGEQDHSGIHGAHGPAGQRRAFRRKSG
ncbi:MAG: DUF5302 domain-containing protein [Actinomycetia bacterium]|nr:DUF5302 domain-containing protein [Actinomycetes bacterium]